MKFIYSLLGIIILCIVSCNKENPDIECSERIFYKDTIRTSYKEVFYKGMVSFYNRIPGDTVNQILKNFQKLQYYCNTTNSVPEYQNIIVLINTSNCLETDQLFSQILKDPRVSNCNKYLISRMNLWAVSDRFYCRLKNDIYKGEMHELIEKTGTQLMDTLKPPYPSGTYEIRADKFSKGDAIDMATEFYESGYFLSSQPLMYPQFWE